MMKKRMYLVGFAILLVLCVASGVYFLTQKSGRSVVTSASNTSFALNTSTQWNLGSKINALNSGNSLQINDKSASSSQDRSTWTITGSPNSGLLPLILTIWLGAEWNNYDSGIGAYVDSQFIIDAQAPITFNDLWVYSLSLSQYKDGDQTCGTLQVSENGSDYTTLSDHCIDGNVGAMYHWAGSPSALRYTGTNVTARYIKVSITTNDHGPDQPVKWEIHEPIYIATSALATHTSASTQIDGSEGGTKNFIAWQTFTPTYTTPANTTVSYKFRSSPDGSTWTSWSASQTPASGGAFDISSIVDSASGANKYLQVETTLSNTDGTSTPTVDSYSVGYHTNIKPSKPTAATAVIGE